MSYDNNTAFRPANNPTKTAKLTALEIDRNKKISKKIYIRFQPVGFIEKNLITL